MVRSWRNKLLQKDPSEKPGEDCWDCQKENQGWMGWQGSGDTMWTIFSQLSCDSSQQCRVMGGRRKEGGGLNTHKERCQVKRRTARREKREVEDPGKIRYF